MSGPDTLAIRGGTPLRAAPMPARFALGEDEERMIAECIRHYRAIGLDPGFQDTYEKRYTDAFVATLGGGYADAVGSGTLALYVAIAALDLPPGSEMLVSPITDAGTISAIILNRLKPRLVDARPDSYNAGAAEFERRIGPDVRALCVVHSIGQAAPIDAIMDVARKHGLAVLEDCSQSHGATCGGRPVGTFGDIAAFSTMYRKAHMAGGCGGIVYARDLELHRRALAHADRGKPRWRADYDDRNPNQFLFPALNHHTDEISCAIGCASLARLGDTMRRRRAFVAEFARLLAAQSDICRPYAHADADSPFIFPVIVDPARITCTPKEFAEAVRAEGIGLNPHYEYLVADWPWAKPHLADDFATPVARSVRDRSFCLYLNENYGPAEARDAAAAIAKVERHFRR
ncbi:MAG TPA: DegT/DnrJ/EryC1/StrS family aminotransferase [Stellaceae bacterium]|nr:DegT/DnrJ/EryC1/StrS family aminotransferase [Stellaceae bacterium]